MKAGTLPSNNLAVHFILQSSDHPEHLNDMPSNGRIRS